MVLIYLMYEGQHTVGAGVSSLAFKAFLGKFDEPLLVYAFFFFF